SLHLRIFFGAGGSSGLGDPWFKAATAWAISSSFLALARTLDLFLTFSTEVGALISRGTPCVSSCSKYCVLYSTTASSCTSAAGTRFCATAIAEAQVDISAPFSGV
ncbi:unnamed protein product, partial [Pylaiella littoralis]